MKIKSYVLIVLLAFIVVSCADRIFSKDKDSPLDPRTVQERLNPTWAEARTQNLERDLKTLEYRVRELGFIQRGTGAVATGVTSDTVYLESSYADMNYTLLVTGNSDRGIGYAQKINSQSFLVVAGAIESPPAEYSWLTIGQ